LGARFSAPVQTGPGTHPVTYTMDTGSFPGVKRPERGVDHPLPTSAKVKERVELYLYSTSGSSWPVIGWTLFLHQINTTLRPLYPPKMTRCPLYSRLGGPQGLSGLERENLASRTAQPVTSRCTDWAIPPHVTKWNVTSLSVTSEY